MLVHINVCIVNWLLKLFLKLGCFMEQPSGRGEESKKINNTTLTSRLFVFSLFVFLQNCVLGFALKKILKFVSACVCACLRVCVGVGGLGSCPGGHFFFYITQWGRIHEFVLCVSVSGNCHNFVFSLRSTIVY